MIKKLILIALMFCCGCCLSAQTVHQVRDSVKIYFRQGSIELDPFLNGNRQALDRISDSLRTSYADSVYRLQRILVVGAASPEGGVRRNEWLSGKRADVLFGYSRVTDHCPTRSRPPNFLGRDWNGLIRLVEDDPEVPYREETLAMLHEIADEANGNVPAGGDHLQRIRQLRGGVPYYYMYRNLFPELRASWLYLWYEKMWNPMKVKPMPRFNAEIHISPADTVPGDSVSIRVPRPRNFYMDVRTNMLYDLLAVPNIGVQFYLGKGWSVTADWMYGWWKANRSHWYWRAYGGGIALRKWFGKAAVNKPLTGHHIGVYGHIFTYDIETGGRGYMGGKPGGTLWNKMNYAAGVEYGYSLPVARRLNIDFTIGVGYWGGTYHEYKPEDGCYVWQYTRERHWFGPTKAEVSLVWLIGHGNRNMQKGGGL